MNGYWKKPNYFNSPEGGVLLLGPLQFNWYNGFRVYLTWPGRTKTVWSR